MKPELYESRDSELLIISEEASKVILEIEHLVEIIDLKIILFHNMTTTLLFRAV